MPKSLIDITPGPLSLAETAAFVNDPAAGGIDIFIGTTRNNAEGRQVLFLEYEAYPPMALSLMRELAEEIGRKWEITKIAMVHRIGRVDIGEASVIIAVSSPHRNEAFLACRYAIDTLKATVPIWKKEYFAGGEIWVGQPNLES